MEETVKQELSVFLHCQISAESLSCIDDIVLGYIVSVLEQLGEDEQFDEEEFAEIMDAYIPGFDTINRLFFSEANTLKNTNSVSLPSRYKEDHQKKSSLDGNSNSSSSDRATSSLNSESRCRSQGIIDNMAETIADDKKKSASEGVSVLAEMFPDACSLDIEHCLTIANGDTESTVQLMLLKSERSTAVGKENTPEILDFSPKTHCPSAKRQELKETEQKHLKEQLMARYGYVDVSQDEKTHQPILQTQDKKKLVRYRDSQVVSTKGERFSWVKQQENEEMKKTYVNLKPARKYRFH
ncbi:CUE domain-containing protein 2-A-like [Porites lutea]|uniref:CUE domain-containing protein 2-A-like n=1 Tax=Porites lutea TaxID=51062 RepID=UPI003CC5EEC8